MDIKYEELESSLAKGKLQPLYLLYGDEKYLIDVALKKIKKAFGELVVGINFISIEDNNIEELISNIETPAFGYDKKLIIVKNSGLFKKDGRKKEPTPLQKKISEYIDKNIDTISDMAIIVFVENTVDKTSVFDMISKNGVVCEISELKVPDIAKKLKQVCMMYKVNVEISTINYLIETSGTSLQVLMNEIRKLIEYAGEGGKITNEDVDNLATHQIESVIFELTDNLGNKKTDKAIEVLDNLIYQKEPSQKILITLYNHFKKLYLCSIAMELNKDIVSSLNLKPNQTFLVSKYKKQVSYFSKQDLRNILNEFVKIDYKSKVRIGRYRCCIKSHFMHLLLSKRRIVI